MSYKYSAAHLAAIRLSPPDLIHAAADAGYDYVSLRLIPTTDQEPHHDLAGDAALMRATKQALQDTGMSVWDCEVIRMDPDHGPDFYIPMMEAAAELGVKHYITQTPDPDVERAKDRFARACELAAPLGLTLDLEFISWYLETGDVTKAASILEATNATNKGMLVDILQFERSNSRIEDLTALPTEWFTWCHLCDAPAKRPDTLEDMTHQGRAERQFPGQGGLRVREILEALPDGIVCSLEIPGETLASEIGYPAYLGRALEETKAYMERNFGHG